MHPSLLVLHWPGREALYQAVLDEREQDNLRDNGQDGGGGDLSPTNQRRCGQPGLGIVAEMGALTPEEQDALGRLCRKLGLRDSSTGHT